MAAATGGTSLLKWLSKNKKAFKAVKVDDSESEDEEESETEKERREKQERKEKENRKMRLIAALKKHEENVAEERELMLPPIDDRFSTRGIISRKDTRRDSVASSRLSNYGVKFGYPDSQDSAYNTESENGGGSFIDEKRSMSTRTGKFPPIKDGYEESTKRKLAIDIAALKKYSLSPRPVDAFALQSKSVHKSRFAQSCIKKTLAKRDRDILQKPKFKKVYKQGRWVLEDEEQPDEETTRNIFSSSSALHTIQKEVKTGPVKAQAFDNYKPFVTEENTTKKKKKEKQVTIEENNTNEKGSPDIESTEIVEIDSKPLKKRKKKKKTEIPENDNENVVMDSKDSDPVQVPIVEVAPVQVPIVEVVGSDSDKPVKKRKKSKKLKKKEEKTEEDVETHVQSTPVVIPEIMEDNVDEIPEDVEDTEKHKSKKKKKKKLSKKDKKDKHEEHEEDKVDKDDSNEAIEEKDLEEDKPAETLPTKAEKKEDHEEESIDEVEDFFFQKIKKQESKDEGINQKTFGKLLRSYLNKKYVEIDNAKASEDTMQNQVSAIVENSKKEKEQISNLRKAEQDKISKKLERKLKVKKEIKAMVDKALVKTATKTEDVQPGSSNGVD